MSKDATVTGAAPQQGARQVLQPARSDADAVLASRARMHDATSTNDLIDDHGADTDKAPGPTSSGPTGVGYVDHGHRCANQPTGKGCTLTNDQRHDLMALYPARVANARSNFNLAITEMKFETLLQKSDDPSWISNLVLELASSFLLGSIGSAIKAFRTEKLADSANRIALNLPAQAVTALSEKQIEAPLSVAFIQGKKLASDYLTAANRLAVTEEQKAVVPFLEAIRRGAAPGFHFFAEDLPSREDDDALVAAFLGFDDNRHTIELYKEAIAAKLERFKSSGVGDIGRRIPGAFGTAHDLDDRITRAVWVTYRSGAPRRLMLESQWGPMPERLLPEGMPIFGFVNPKGPSELQPVAREFESVALARHLEAWLVAPTSVEVDDSWLAPRRGVLPPGGAPKTAQVPSGAATGANSAVPSGATVSGHHSGAGSDHGLPPAPWGRKSIISDTPR